MIVYLERDKIESLARAHAWYPHMIILNLIRLISSVIIKSQNLPLYLSHVQEEDETRD